LPPCTACPHHIQDRIHDRPARVFLRPPTGASLEVVYEFFAGERRGVVT